MRIMLLRRALILSSQVTRPKKAERLLRITFSAMRKSLNSKGYLKRDDSENTRAFQAENKLPFLNISRASYFPFFNKLNTSQHDVKICCLSCSFAVTNKQ